MDYIELVAAVVVVVIALASIAVLVLAAVAIVAAFTRARVRVRFQRLMRIYGDEALVRRIMAGEVWQGQTAQMLEHARGLPVKVDEKVLKTKTKHTWKYGEMGRGQYALRVMLENGEVVGWDVKRR